MSKPSKFGFRKQEPLMIKSNIIDIEQEIDKASDSLNFLMHFNN